MKINPRVCYQQPLIFFLVFDCIQLLLFICFNRRLWKTTDSSRSRVKDQDWKFVRPSLLPLVPSETVDSGSSSEEDEEEEEEGTVRRDLTGQDNEESAGGWSRCIIL